MKLKNAYDDHNIASNETGLNCPEPTLTQQHDEHDANINNIVATYMKTGQLQGHNRPPLESDFEMITSMQDAMQLIIDARQAFMQQPAQVRSRFNNDPAAFVAFCSDDANKDEMLKMGLLSEEAMQKHKTEAEGRLALAAAEKAELERLRALHNAPKS